MSSYIPPTFARCVVSITLCHFADSSRQQHHTVIVVKVFVLSVAGFTFQTLKYGVPRTIVLSPTVPPSDA
jgi:hypothetical protein